MVAGMVFADPIQMVPQTISNIATNGAVVTTNTTERTSGYFEGFYIDLSVTTITTGVKVATAPSTASGASRTLCEIGGITADGYYSVRIPTYTATGTILPGTNYTRYPLTGDKLLVSFTNATSTNADATIYFYVDRNR